MSEAGVAPAAGSMPTKKPSSEPIVAVPRYSRTRAKFCKVERHDDLTVCTCTSERVWSSVHSISPIP